MRRGLIDAKARLLLMRLYVPAAMRRRELEELFGRTAAAFAQPVPPARGRSVRARLADFARATRDWAEAALAAGEDLEGIDARLYRSARHLGRVYRARLGIGSLAQAFAAARAIYRGLGIDLKADPRTGSVTVHRCMFSACYSARVCRVISALDRGLFSGLSGGGELAFSRRITEGHAQCRAHFLAAGQPTRSILRATLSATPRANRQTVRRAIVVGSGAGGAAVARELPGSYQVTILEAGTPFRPLSLPFRWMEQIRAWRLLVDARAIGLAFPSMKVRKATGGVLLVNGRGTGGSTTLSTGNALRFDDELAKLGVQLGPEFERLSREVPQSIEHTKRWTAATRRLYAACEELGLAPRPTPKMIDFGRCRRCGRCVLGCPNGAKWDSRRFLEDAIRAGAVLETGWRVRRVVIRGGKAVGVVARRGLRTIYHPADLVVLAAGGLGTPAILERSGIRCEPRLFVDPVLTVAAPWPDSGQRTEIPMPFVVQRPGYIVSPYFDYVSWLFDKRWRRPADRMLGLMIKLADTECGSVSAKGHGIGRERIRKALTEVDHHTLAEAVELCSHIFEKLGVDRRSIFLGTLNAGHPGGMLPLTAAEADTLHPTRLPPNLYVADASLLPASLGNPPILTIMALAMRIGRLCAGRRQAEVLAPVTGQPELLASGGRQADVPVYTESNHGTLRALRPDRSAHVPNPT
jgi:ferredoxin